MKLTPQEKEKISQQLKNNCILSPNKINYFSSHLSDVGIREKDSKINLILFEIEKKISKNNFKIFYNKILKKFEESDQWERYEDNESARGEGMICLIK